MKEKFEALLKIKRDPKIDKKFADGFAERQAKREELYSSTDAHQKVSNKWLNREYG